MIPPQEQASQPSYAMQRFDAEHDQYQRFLVLGPEEPQPGNCTRSKQGILVCLPGQQRSEELAQHRRPREVLTSI